MGTLRIVRARSSMAEHAAHNRWVDGSNPSGPIVLMAPVEGVRFESIRAHCVDVPRRGGAIRIHPGPLC